MKRCVHLIAFAAAMLAAASATAAPALTHLPARFQGKDVFLPVGIDGGRPLWMKLDVNGAPTSVSRQTVTGLRAPSDVVLRIGSVDLSGVALRTQTATTALGPDGQPLAGVIGIDALGDHPLWIDTKHKQVWLSESPPADTPPQLRTAALSH